jgi:hypothetical protein
MSIETGSAPEPASNFLPVYLGYESFISARQLSSILRAIDRVHDEAALIESGLPASPARDEQDRALVRSIHTGNSILIEITSELYRYISSLDSPAGRVVEGALVLALTGRILVGTFAWCARQIAEMRQQAIAIRDQDSQVRLRNSVRGAIREQLERNGVRGTELELVARVEALVDPLAEAAVTLAAPNITEIRIGDALIDLTRPEELY